MTKSIKITRANAISTLISGLAIIAFQGPLVQLFDIRDPLPFIIIGSVITFFSLTMFIEIKKQRALALLWIIIQDFLFVAASIFIIIFKPFEIALEGYWLLAFFLIPIVYFIIAQSRGLISMDSIDELGTKQMTFKRLIHANIEEVWSVVSDLENYHQVASNIDQVKILSGEGEGMIRSCSHGNKSWTETCTLWDEKNQYSFVVDTQTPDYPFPFKYLKGNWKVEGIESDKSEIIMTFHFEYRHKIQQLLLHPILKWQFSKIGKNLLENWRVQIEGK